MTDNITEKYDDRLALVRSRTHPIGLALILAFILAPGLALSATQNEPWVMIDTLKQTLSVIKNKKILKIFPRVSLGRNGYATDRQQGDGKTPLGVFHVAWINPNSQFHLFFGLDYPSHAQAESAFRQKRIDFDTYFNIRKALFGGLLPPQDTALGGSIGIHGIGNGDPRIHATSNWTEGCVALTNREVDTLARWVTLGTEVVITDGTSQTAQQPADESGATLP